MCNFGIKTPEIGSFEPGRKNASQSPVGDYFMSSCPSLLCLFIRLVDIVYLLLVYHDAKQHLGYAPCAIPLWLWQGTYHLVLVPSNQVKMGIALLKILSQVVFYWECSPTSSSATIFPLRFRRKVKVDGTFSAIAPCFHIPLIHKEILFEHPISFIRKFVCLCLAIQTHIMIENVHE